MVFTEALEKIRREVPQKVLKQILLPANDGGLTQTRKPVTSTYESNITKERTAFVRRLMLQVGHKAKPVSPLYCEVTMDRDLSGLARRLRS